MRLLKFDDFSVLLVWDRADDSWSVTKVFRHIPGRTSAEDSSVSALPWSVRIAIAEFCGNPLP
jgi:hypothetical protein